MQYKIDITDSYQQFMCLDSDIGLAAYFSLPDINDIKETKMHIRIDNIEVNMSDKKWFLPIISTNEKSVINNGLKKINIDEPDCIYSVIISKSTLMVEGVKCVYLFFEKDGKKSYHTSGKGFNIGDRFIWLAGNSADFSDTRFSAMLVFSGKVEYAFDEKDVIIQSLDLEQKISYSEAQIINEAQRVLTSRKNRDTNEMELNNIRSKFLDYEFYRNYFVSDENGNIAYKSFSV